MQDVRAYVRVYKFASSTTKGGARSFSPQLQPISYSTVYPLVIFVLVKLTSVWQTPVELSETVKIVPDNHTHVLLKAVCPN